MGDAITFGNLDLVHLLVDRGVVLNYYAPPCEPGYVMQALQ